MARRKREESACKKLFMRLVVTGACDGPVWKLGRWPGTVLVSSCFTTEPKGNWYEVAIAECEGVGRPRRSRGGTVRVCSRLMPALCWLVLFGAQVAHATTTPSNVPQREATRSPHGAALNVPCENCHTAAAWRPIRKVPEFDHSKTNYPLRGMHEKVKCAECHVKPVFTNVGKNCQDCHTDVHQRKMGTDCASCHTVFGWNISTQQLKDHQNRFPLFGTHAAVPCEECHKSAAVGQFQGLSTLCISCHQNDFQSASNPNHVASSFPTTCETCHTADSWLTSNFNHNSVGFPLTAGHANVPCASCHINNNYNLQIGATDCGNSQCHLTTWQQTNNPVHSTSGAAFAAANCANCHTTAGWDTASVDHSVTGFALVGTHMSPTPTPCASCHISNNYSLSSSDCIGCHLDAWNSTPTYGGNVPDHIKSGFPQTASACATCHPITKWSDGKFDHSTTGWALTGAHVATPCGSCHINNNYALTAANTDCYGCHTAAWQSTVTLGGGVPNHIAAGYPTTCATCHTTSSWLGATFNHTYFPIPHHGSVCTDCHLVSTDYSTFSCINCHTQTAHQKQQTDQTHNGVGGYVYGPTTCYNCHKNGGGG